LGFGAGTDFDTKVAVKSRAPELLRKAFDRPSWKGELLVFSGVTDCYQPLEASLRLTRGCLEVCAEYQNPVGIITKAPLIERDLAVLERLRDVARVTVTVSIPFFRPDIARALEPGVATPKRRIQTIQTLAKAGIPVGVNVAPLIPGLDEDMPSVLEHAAEAGARWAGSIVLRLPGSVKEVFETRLRRELPLHADKVMHRVREMRGGKLYDARFGRRQRGDGVYAEQMAALFALTCQRLGLNEATVPAPQASTFRRPAKQRAQLGLFEP
jgi:DNA repair photolyase